MTKIKGKTVLITGGASGIGKLMGEACLNKGASKLYIFDINQEVLNDCVLEFRAKGLVVFPYLVDVSNLNEVQAISKEILKEGPVDILINNAGIVTGKPFSEQSPQEISKTIAINIEAVMQVARSFLPAMIAQKSGHIVNIASAASMMANPNMSVYAGSKWAVLGWSESLRIELELLQDLHVTTVTPSYIDTGMFEGVKSPLLLPILKPEKVVKAIIRGVERNRLFVRKPLLVYSLPFVKGVLPVRVFDWLVGSVLGVYKSMDRFKGHQNK